MNHSIDNINKTKENINNINDEYKCYRCGYTHIKKHTLITHFNRKKPCKKYETNCLSDAEIDLLNHNQFKNKKDSTNKNIIKETKNSQENTYINIENQTIIINLIPFNQEWDLSHISEHEILKTLFSNTQYTDLYKDILKNHVNSNVIIDPKTNTCKIFNDNKTYGELKLYDTISKEMNKLHKTLHNLIEPSQKNFCKEYKNEKTYNENDKDFSLCENKDGGALDKLFEYIRENIDEKYEIFQKRSDIKESVIKFFTDILINNQKQALSYLKNHTVNNLKSGY